jgi:hypothetical protein
MSFEVLLPPLFVTLGAWALWIGWFRPRLMPFLLAATLPCNNFLIEWHVQWSPGKVVLLAFGLVLPFHLLKRSKLPLFSKLPHTVRRFLAIQLLLTIIAYFFFRGSIVDPGLDTMRNPTYRSLVQLISEWIRVGALLAIIGWVRDRQTVLRIYKICLAVTTSAALYGVYQFVGYYAGLPITGIARAQADFNGQYAVIEIAGVELFRVGSFVGEPKHLAEWLIPSIVFIVCTKVFPSLGVRSWLTSYLVLLLHIAALMLTFATSSYLGLLLGLFPMAWLYRGSSTNVARVAAVAGIISIAGFSFASLIGSELSRQILMERTVDRVGQEEPSLVVDTAAIRFLEDHPAYLLSGVGVGNASFHLDDYVPGWVGQQFDNPVPLSISSMYLLLLIEGGLPVLLLFVLFLTQHLLEARELALAAKRQSDRALILTSAAICCMVAALGGFYSTEEDGMLWLYWGLLLTTCGIIARATSRKTEARALTLEMQPLPS